MKFVFLNSSFIHERMDKIQITTPGLRVGVASLIAYLREHGADISLIDTQLQVRSLEALTDEIIRSQPDYLCFSSYTEEIIDAAEIAKSVKAKAPNIETIIGGYHVSALPEKTLQEFPDFDLGVIGEGEQALLSILRGEASENIPGIIYRQDNSEKRLIINNGPDNMVCLDTLPFPAWDLYDLPAYDNFIPIEPLRGCPFDCIFCFRAVGKQVRYKSPARIVEEIEYCIQEYGSTNFRFIAGTFPLNKKHTREVCERIVSKNLTITWSSSTRVDCLDEEVLTLAQKSGCRKLQLGIESGDVDILKFCSKGVMPDKSIEIVKLCAAIGISVGLNFIIGLPHETHKSLFKTFVLSQKLRHYTDTANFAILVPFPGTETYELALANKAGIKLVTTDWRLFGKQAGFALQHANFTHSQLIRYQSLLYMCYYALKPQKLFHKDYFHKAFHVLKRFLPLNVHS